MRKYFLLEIISVVLAYFYQYASKNIENKFIGITKLDWFLIFGIYSTIITLYEIYIIVIQKKSSILTQKIDSINFIFAGVLYLSISIFIILRIDVKNEYSIVKFITGLFS